MQRQSQSNEASKRELRLDELENVSGGEAFNVYLWNAFIQGEAVGFLKAGGTLYVKAGH
jgi:hypothetical protein